MKNLLITILIILIAQGVSAQAYQLSSDQSTMQVLGTSNLHDWEVLTNTLSGKAWLKMSKQELTIQSLKFSTRATSLKSKKKAMDTKTHEALKAKQHPQITFLYQETLSSQYRQNSFLLRARGSLTIAGVSKEVILNVKATPQGEAFRFQGSTSLNMEDYGVNPPTALFGTITTDKQITIQFDVTYSTIN